MPRSTRKNPAVREFILRNVEKHPRDIASATMEKFALSRTAIARYTRRLVEEGLLEVSGNTSARRYALKKESMTFDLQLTAGLSEDAVWRFRMLPELKDFPKNVVDICHYGFTEILNNAID